MKKLLLALWLMAVIAPIGCETRETLVGKWEGPRERPAFIAEEIWPHTAKPLYKVEFFEDGTFALKLMWGGERDPLLEGKYQLLDNQTIALQVTTRVKHGMRYALAPHDSGTFKGELQKEKLAFTDPTALSCSLKR